MTHEELNSMDNRRQLEVELHEIDAALQKATEHNMDAYAAKLRYKFEAIQAQLVGYETQFYEYAVQG